MSKVERVGCMCACDCPFLADLPPLYGMLPYRCPECEEAHAHGKGPCADEPKIRIHFRRINYGSTAQTLRSR